MEKAENVGKTGNELTPVTLIEIAHWVKGRLPEGANVAIGIQGIGNDTLRTIDVELYKMANGGSEEGFNGDADMVTATVGGVRFDIHS